MADFETPTKNSQPWKSPQVEAFDRAEEAATGAKNPYERQYPPEDFAAPKGGPSSDIVKKLEAEAAAKRNQGPPAELLRKHYDKRPK